MRRLQAARNPVFGVEIPINCNPHADSAVQATAHHEASAPTACGLAPLITSHSMRTITPKTAGWEIVNTLS